MNMRHLNRYHKKHLKKIQPHSHQTRRRKVLQYNKDHMKCPQPTLHSKLKTVLKDQEQGKDATNITLKTENILKDQKQGKDATFHHFFSPQYWKY